MIEVIREKMLTQDPRSTSWPVFIVVESKKIYGVDSGASDGRERKDSDYFHIDDLCEECEEKFKKTGRIPEECASYEECSDDTFVYYRLEDDVPNLRAAFFFTAEACDAHIAANPHHYNKTAHSYAISAYHNAELKAVIEYLAGKKLS